MEDRGEGVNIGDNHIIGTRFYGYIEQGEKGGDEEMKEDMKHFSISMPLSLYKRMVTQTFMDKTYVKGAISEFICEAVKKELRDI